MERGAPGYEELSALHDELSRRVTALEAELRRKDAVFAMVSHDLRNPLASVAGFSRLLARTLDGSLDPRSTALLGRITRLSEHMLSLVDDLLDVTVIEQGQLVLQRDGTDVAETVGEIVDSYRLPAAEKDVGIELHRPDGPVVAIVDRSRILQVVDNLLSNAVKFSPNQAGATVTVTCFPSGGSVRITVADEGVGIPRDRREEVFEPFSSSRTPGTAAERSTGLGLAISRSIVRAHGGVIDIDSEPGHGTVFQVVLPRHPPTGDEQATGRDGGGA